MAKRPSDSQIRALRALIEDKSYPSKSWSVLLKRGWARLVPDPRGPMYTMDMEITDEGRRVLDQAEGRDGSTTTDRTAILDTIRQTIAYYCDSIPSLTDDQAEQLVEMNRRQLRAVAIILREAWRHAGGHALQFADDHEIKVFQVTHPYRDWSVVIEMGRKNDEGTAAEVFCRDRAHFFVGPRGGIRWFPKHGSRAVRKRRGRKGRPGRYIHSAFYR